MEYPSRVTTQTPEPSPADLRVLEERVRRFKRLGGVDLSRLEPEHRDIVVANVQVGIEPVKKAKFRFRCPVCRKIEVQDMEMEPACTGPNWTDDHPMTVMERIQ